MNDSEFEKIFEARTAMCRATLCKKAGEYADEGDRLHNFKVAAELEGCCPEKALAGMMAKHTVSVYDLIEALDNGADISPDVWNEKIGDSLNYLYLLYALLMEREKEKNMYNTDISRKEQIRLQIELGKWSKAHPDATSEEIECKINDIYNRIEARREARED